jgi:hypothetical protein
MLFCMPNYRPDWTPGGTWFFTVNLLQRRGNDLLTANFDCLRDCIALERTRRPFSVIAGGLARTDLFPALGRAELENSALC